MKSRDFAKDILTHCYQRTADNGVLFYSYGDCLEYFTRYCLLSEKYGIRVFSLCLMPDHVHDAVSAGNRTQMKSFRRELDTRFSRSYNARTGLSGQLFERPYGSAVKFSAKKARTNLIYIGNNPVERQLVSHAEEYRWNFLAYAASDHPFSEKLVIRKASWPLRKAIQEVKAQHNAKLPVVYAMTQRLFKPLTQEERQQLTDYIICLYNVIDYSEALRFFDGSYDDMLTAMHSTTGSEYDLNEVFLGKSDKPYYQMNRILLQQAGLQDIHDFLSWDVERKYDLFLLLRKYTGVMNEQIAKYLHLPMKRV